MEIVKLKLSVPSYSCVYKNTEIIFLRGDVKKVSDAFAQELLKTGFFETASVGALQELEGFKRETVKAFHRQQVGRELPKELKDKRIVLVREGGIGNIIFLLPLAKWLRRRGVHVSIACSPYYIDIQHFQNVVKEWIPINPDMRSELSRFDAVLNFRGVIELNENAVKMPAVDAVFKWVGVNNKKIKAVDKAPKFKLSRRAEMIGDRTWRRWELGKETVIGLHLKASSKIRSWYPEHNRKLALALGEQGLKIILLDATDEVSFYGKGVINYASKLDLEGLAGILNRCDLVVGPDSGILHIAGCLGKPIIGIFSSFNASYRLSYYPGARWIQGKYSCAPCFFHLEQQCNCKELGGYPPCMREIKMETVYAEIRKALADIKDINISAKAKSDRKKITNGSCSTLQDAGVIESVSRGLVRNRR